MKYSPVLFRSALAGILVAAAAPAFADTVIITNGEPGTHRSGLMLGASIDGGHIGCQAKSGEDCGEGAHPAGGLSVHAGMMISPRFAILGEAWGMAHTENSLTASQILTTANVRAWIMPRLWLQGGVGVARSQLSFETESAMVSVMSSTVPAVSAGIGLELVHGSRFGLDLELRGGSGLYEGDVRIYNAALGVGVTFF